MLLRAKTAATASFVFHALYWYPAVILQIGGGTYTENLPAPYAWARFLPLAVALFMNVGNLRLNVFFSFLPALAFAIAFQSWIAVKGIVYGLTAYYVCDYFHRRHNHLSLIQGLVLLHFLFLFMQLSQIVRGADDYGFFIRFVGSLGGPNICGGIMAMLALFFLELFYLTERKRFALLFVSCVVFLLATLSIGATLSFLVVFFIRHARLAANFFLQHYNKFFVGVAVLLSYTYLSGTLTKIISYLLQSNLYERWRTLYFFLAFGTRTGTTGTFSYRITSAKMLIERLSHSPENLLLGVGGDHENYYLAVFGTLGLIGAFLYFAPLLWGGMNFLGKGIRRYYFILPALIQAMFVPVWIMYTYVYFIIFLLFQFPLIAASYSPRPEIRPGIVSLYGQKAR